MATQMKFPIGIQAFDSLRMDGFVYVDKTPLMRKLVETGKVYFLSRPRRFGKSLLVSTLKAYFEGKRELFKGLAIDRDDVNWTPSPVLYFDFNPEQYRTIEELESRINKMLCVYEEIYGRKEYDKTFPQRFESLIWEAHKRTGQRVVVLVDEYDKPLLQAIGKPELMAEFRSLLKPFYGVLKSTDAHVRFALITGVTKFSKVSIFSDLNNLNDISNDARFAEICGLTEQELRDNFDDQIGQLGEANNLSKEEAYAKMKRMYDGYHFTRCINAPGVYNPFSVMCALSKCEFRDFWFATGTPSFLIQVLKQTNYRLEQLLEEPSITSDLMGELNSFNKTPLPILYQSGYLTIVGYEERFDEYTLAFPNHEVEYGFFKYLSSIYTHDQEKEPESTSSPFYIEKFVKDLEHGRTEDFMQRLDTFLCDSDYQIAGEAELYFQNVIFVVLKMLGFYVKAERHTSYGRIDLLLQTHDFVYIIEFKLDATAEEAIQQIEDKEYAKPFALDERKIIKIGANFSSETRHLTGWQII